MQMFNIRMRLDITKNGESFFESDNTWHAMSYQVMRVFEKMFKGILDQADKLGDVKDQQEKEKAGALWIVFNDVCLDEFID